MESASRRNELARFLRSRRERLSPAEAGIPDGGRRRTPGLRREELALMAGVSASWYTWLEQGRDVTASPQVLESLARSLHLSAEERVHLFILARGDLPVATTTAIATVDGGTQQVLDALTPLPAYVVNAHWEVVAWNTIACRVFLDFAALASERERNLLRLLFTNRTLRGCYEDWGAVARRMIALFRVSTAQSIGEAWHRDLIAELCQESREFQVWWPQHDLSDSPRDVKAVCHPQVGRLYLRPNPLQVAHAPDSWMLVYTPAPETDTLSRLETLLAVRDNDEATSGSTSPTN